jgi:hypothetical protein
VPGVERPNLRQVGGELEQRRLGAIGRPGAPDPAPPTSWREAIGGRVGRSRHGRARAVVEDDRPGELIEPPMDHKRAHPRFRGRGIALVESFSRNVVAILDR